MVQHRAGGCAATTLWRLCRGGEILALTQRLEHPSILSLVRNSHLDVSAKQAEEDGICREMHLVKIFYTVIQCLYALVGSHLTKVLISLALGVTLYF